MFTGEMIVERIVPRSALDNWGTISAGIGLIIGLIIGLMVIKNIKTTDGVIAWMIEAIPTAILAMFIVTFLSPRFRWGTAENVVVILVAILYEVSRFASSRRTNNT